MSTAVALEPVVALPGGGSPAGHAKRTPVEMACDLMASAWDRWQFVFAGVSWIDYLRLLDARRAAGRGAVRIVYAGGEVEIVTVGNFHERWKKTLSGLLETYLIEARIDFAPSGGLTIKREDLERGFEPDDSYYIQNVARAGGFRELDFATDPPPDLAVEVENTRSAVPKLPLYAAFRIPEIWRFDGERLTILTLNPDGNYTAASASLAIPAFPLEALGQYLKLAETVSYPELLRRFRDFVRTLPPAG